MDIGESGELPVIIGDHGIGSGQTGNNRNAVIFYFGGSVAATIGGSSFTSSDTPLRIEAPVGSILAPIPFNVTAGNLRVIELG